MAPAEAPPRTSNTLCGVAFALLAIGSVVLAVSMGLNPRRTIDFGVYYQAAERFVHSEALYRDDDGAMPFKYAPPAAALFVPFLALPKNWAAAAWNVMSVLLLFQFLRSAFAETKNHVRLLALLGIAQPFFYELFYGQVDVACLVLLAVSATFAQKQAALSGTALAIAMLLKPTSAIFALLFIKQKHWKALAFSLVGLLIFLMPTLSLYGSAGTAELFHSWAALVSKSTIPWMTGHNSQGLSSLFAAFLSPLFDAPEVVLAVSQILSALILAVILFTSRAGPKVDFAIACLAAVLVSPIGWRANFVLAAPALLLAWKYRTEWTAASIVAVGAIVITVLTLEPLLGADLQRTVLSLRPFGLVFTALAITLRQVKVTDVA